MDINNFLSVVESAYREGFKAGFELASPEEMDGEFYNTIMSEVLEESIKKTRKKFFELYGAS
jgi:hypothetical protein